MNVRSCTGVLLALTLSLLVTPSTDAAKPANPGNGGGKPGSGGTKLPPNPDIVYMSANSRTMNGPAIRGFTLENSTDIELAKAKNGRGKGSISWSPDGKWYAWIEIVSQTSSILIAAPGQAPRVIYSAQWGDPSKPYPDGYNSDQLAWGPGCNPGTSVLVFQGFGGPDNSPQGIYAIDNPEQNGAPFIPRELSPQAGASGFAFSPTGQHLAYRFSSSNERILALPLCPTPGSPFDLVPKTDVGGTDDYWAISSIDWSRSGDRLAMSVVVGPDPDYPWRDLKIAYLNYSVSDGTETINGLQGVRSINLDSTFGAASSEHSPQWGPSSSGESCQRIAFSQSAGASDGSSMNGRRLFLLDVGNWLDTASCQINAPLELGARDPRAIDWK
jgi:hypothetical protein